jgi:(1->4)-alpha-D-glucan 1-alpha-D-glucosylmutase
MQIPRATYRLQFNEHFRLADALALVPYLDSLGISHIYASPLFKATPHSTHGYDICDYDQLNPELGTEGDLEKLVQALHARKMGLVLDIVPNHMGIASPENSWWWDVLTHGEKSPFAAYFDVDWKPADKNLRGKILVPVLGGEYEALLRRGEFQVLYERDKFVLGYHEHRLPVAPKTAPKLPADPAALREFSSNFTAVDQLIRRQAYQLVFHEQGDARVNYRRFFAVSSLAAVRVEDEKIFEATHQRLRRWVENGWIDGLRVDHPDGLRDPAAYLQRLRALAPRAWIVVEKILEPGESLPAAWPVQGTTGYDFLNQVNNLAVDAAAEETFTGQYVTFTGETADYDALLLDKKREVLKTLLAAELSRLTRLLAAIAARYADARHYSSAQFQESLAEVVVCLPVYRTYITDHQPARIEDVAVIKSAVHLACENRKDLPPEIFAFIHALLLKPQPGAGARNFVACFQQLTGAVMAKGAEDTAFYCFNRFISLNEVGGHPGKFGGGPAEFHRFMQRQAREWPGSQLTTSTHDTKRAEDVRARLNVLSEIPDEWAHTVQRWSAMNSCHREHPHPDRNAEYLYYQMLAGAWPVSEERAQFFMEKASHEARQHTHWSRRHLPYEKALQKFVAETLRDPEFTTDLEHFTARCARAAAINSLAQTLIKLTAPGVPDIYQGCELWDYSLVDPDNRRPVDFPLRQTLLDSCGSLSAEKAWERRAEGLPKMWMIRKTLALRARCRDFSGLDYQPLPTHGAKAEHVVAFSRGGKFITVVPRLLLKLKDDWGETSLELPAGGWRNEFTGEQLHRKIGVANLLRKFPVALLVQKEND